MAKRKEIKFKNNRGSYEGRQDGVIYRIHADRTLLGTCAPAYAVSTYDTKGKGRGINTCGRRRFGVLYDVTGWPTSRKKEDKPK